MRHLRSCVFVMLAIGCAGTTPIPEPESEGAVAYSSRCGACHALPHPKRVAYPQWEHLISLMQVQMEHRKMAVLSPDEREIILGYLRTHAR